MFSKLFKFLCKLLELLLGQSSNATRVAFIVEGVQVEKIKLEVGEQKAVTAKLLLPLNGGVDDTFQGEHWGYPDNSWGLTAADGSSSFSTLAGITGVITATGPGVSRLRFEVDSDASNGQQLLDNEIEIFVPPPNANRVEFEFSDVVVENPPTEPAQPGEFVPRSSLNNQLQAPGVGPNPGSDASSVASGMVRPDSGFDPRAGHQRTGVDPNHPDSFSTIGDAVAANDQAFAPAAPWPARPDSVPLDYVWNGSDWVAKTASSEPTTQPRTKNYPGRR